MKKIIAKGMTSFLIIAVLLIFFSSLSCCYAKEKEDNIKIINNIRSNLIELKLDGYILNIENHTSTTIKNFNVKLEVETAELNYEVQELESYGKESIDLSKYFFKDYLNNKTIKVSLIKISDYFTSDDCIIWLIILFAIWLIFLPIKKAIY